MPPPSPTEMRHLMRSYEECLPSAIWPMGMCEDKEPNKSKKKKEKKKKVKKEKKKKKRKKKSSSDSSSSDSEEEKEPQWVEKSVQENERKTQIKGPQLQRDSWMLAPPDGGLLPVISREELRAKARKGAEVKVQEQVDLDTPGQHEKELNPYWKDGGSGLPEEEKKTPSAAKVAGDGGVGWLRTAIKRCEEQAEERGVSVEEVAAEIYGSLDHLQSRLREAEENVMLAEREKRQARSGHKSSYHSHREKIQDKDRNKRGEIRRQRSRSSSPGSDSDRTRGSRSRSERHAESSHKSDEAEDSLGGREMSRSERARKGGRESRSRDRCDSRERRRSRDRCDSRERRRSRDRGDSRERRRSRDRCDSRERRRSRDRCDSRERRRSRDRGDSRERRRSGDRCDSRERRRSRDRCDSRERRRSRDSERYRSKESNRRTRSRDRDGSRERNGKRSTREGWDGSRDSRRESDRHGSSTRGSKRESNRSPKLGLKSLSGRFKRPDQSSDSDGEKSSSYSRSQTDRRNTSSSSWRKKGFMKPTEHKNDSDDEPHSKRAKFIRPSNDEPGTSATPSQSKSSERRKRSPRSEDRAKPSSSDSSSSSSSSSSDSEEEKTRNASPEPAAEEATVVILSEQEMNQLGAKVVRAEIMGNQALAVKLKAKLEAARKAKENAPKHIKQGAEDKSQARTRREEEVLLTRTDRKGMVRPVIEEEDAIWMPSGGKRRKTKKAKTHAGSKGERERYFADDDKHDLQTLVRQEKMGTAESHDEMFLRLAGKQADKTSDDWQVDDMFVERAAKQQSDAMKEQRDKALAIMEHKKISAAMEKCAWCFEKIPKHLIIAIGIKVYLCLPNHRSLTDGHCMIVPMQHVPQGTSLDEDVWDEIQVFRKGLTKMFEEQDEDCVFMEISKNLKHHPHMYMECVPVPKETGDMAPLYFKKAIMESESEWAQNKKVVDLSRKGIRNSVPKGFPYFSVDFGLQGGFAHVIEDEKIFPYYFGREVVGGMIDAGPELWRKPHKENFDQQRQKVLRFAEWWKPYDWTQRLKTKKDDSESD